MRLVKKYANRKLYDTQEKRYITMDELSGLIKAGEEIKIVDNKTGSDLTAQVVSQLLAREKTDKDRAVPTSVLMQMLRKGRGTLFGYGRKYISLWQGALLMSRDEIEKLINSLVREKEISESEARNLKKEMVGFTSSLRKWMMENIDQRVNEVLSMMNLASKEQVSALTRQVEALSEKVRHLDEQIQQAPRENDHAEDGG
ncbi:MAG: polyhydroxyalkanoate synthesis regulator DNA-binding domain-containing protein [Thermodesulfobacteriota bacterium]